jgi:hypothetical protein
LRYSQATGDRGLYAKGIDRIERAFAEHETLTSPPSELYMGTAGYIAMATDMACRGIVDARMEQVKVCAGERLSARYARRPYTLPSTNATLCCGAAGAAVAIDYAGRVSPNRCGHDEPRHAWSLLEGRRPKNRCSFLVVILASLGYRCSARNPSPFTCRCFALCENE